MAVHDILKEKNDKRRGIQDPDLLQMMILELTCIRMHLEVLTGEKFTKQDIE